jgi:hypothetical protein
MSKRLLRNVSWSTSMTADAITIADEASAAAVARSSAAARFCATTGIRIAGRAHGVSSVALADWNWVAASKKPSEESW